MSKLNYDLHIKLSFGTKTRTKPRLQFEERFFFFAQKAVQSKALFWKCYCRSQDPIEGISWIPRLGVNENLDVDIFPSPVAMHCLYLCMPDLKILPS